MNDMDPTFAKTYKNYGDLGDAKSWLYDWKGLNEWIFQKANAYHSGWYDSLMLKITMLGVSKNLSVFYCRHGCRHADRVLPCAKCRAMPAPNNILYSGSWPSWCWA